MSRLREGSRLRFTAVTTGIPPPRRQFEYEVKPHNIAVDGSWQKLVEEQTDHHDGESAQPAQHDSLNAQQHLPAHSRKHFDRAIGKPAGYDPVPVSLPQGIRDLCSLLRVVKYIPETGCA